MYIQVCTSYVPAVFLGRTSSIPGRIKLYVRYIYMYIPGAHQLAQKNHLGSCSFAWNTSTMLPLGRRQTVEPQDKWHTWDVLETSCIKMTWPEKESKDKNANWHSIDIQLTHVDSCWLVSQVSCKDHFTKNQRTMFNSRDQWSHLLSQANLCGSIKNLRHRLLLASNGIGGNSLSALKHWKPTKRQWSWTVLNCAELCT